MISNRAVFLQKMNNLLGSWSRTASICSKFAFVAAWCMGNQLLMNLCLTTCKSLAGFFVIPLAGLFENSKIFGTENRELTESFIRLTSKPLLPRNSEFLWLNRFPFCVRSFFFAYGSSILMISMPFAIFACSFLKFLSIGSCQDADRFFFQVESQRYNLECLHLQWIIKFQIKFSVRFPFN